jgi:hypothetical protein
MIAKFGTQHRVEVIIVDSSALMGPLLVLSAVARLPTVAGVLFVA